MALVLRLHFPKSQKRNVVIKEPLEKTIRTIKEEVFSSARTQLKGEAQDYELFLYKSSPITTGGADDPASLLSPRSLTNGSLAEVCWLRDKDHLPLKGKTKPQCDIELQKKLNVVKVKYCDRIKTVLLDFSVPLGEWVPLVRKKFDQEDNNELRVYMSGESQLLDIKRPLFDQNFELGECLVLCLRSQNDPIDKATPGLRRRTVFSDLSSNSNENRIFKNNYGVTPVSIASPRPAEEKVTDSSLRGYLLKVNNKNKWEKRWFVLENELLFYYKQATDGKPADVLDIKLYLLKEGEAKKKSYAWNLILSPNAKLGKSSTKRNYSLKTESAKERKKWMTALQRIMDMSASAHCPMPSPPPLLTTANPNFKVKKDRAEMLFGRPLELAVHNPDGSQIPALVVKCINYLDNDRVLSVEGLFRLSGSAMLIDKYVARFDKGEDVDLSTEQDPHTVTGILKYYFRELPEPLMTFPLYDLFTLGAGIIDKSLQLRFLHHLVNRLPPLHRSLLDYLFSFLVRVAANSDKNKMAPPNIATVFAPALLRRFDRDPMASMADSSKINAIVVVLIQDFDFMFRNKEIDLRLTTDETAAMCCLALQDYRPKSPDELSFQKDTTMRILVEDSSFPYCETKLGSFGKVPLSCVQVLSREESQEYARKRQLNQRRKRLMEVFFC